MLIRFLLTMALVSGSFLTLEPAACALPQADQENLFSQAVKDFNDNRFPKAQETFAQIQGPHADDARQYLDKIKDYIDAKNAADDIMRRSMDELDLKTVESAIQEYKKAIVIKSDGPGSPGRKLESAQGMLRVIENRLCTNALEAARNSQFGEAANDSCMVADQDPAHLCGGDEAGKLCKQYTISSIPQTSPPAPQEPTGKHSEMLKEARADYDSNDFQGARAVLASISSDPAAKDYLDRISRYQSSMAQAKLLSKGSKYEEARAAYEGAVGIKPNGPGNPHAGALQMELLEGLDQFYSGDYAAAIQHLGDYSQNRGEKLALAHFYLGASELARYFLGGKEDAKLQQDALNDLRDAKQAGFNADSQEVSPIILQAYRNLAADSPPASN
jgi:hypothetical protein